MTNSMAKESLYCIPYNKTVKKNKRAVVFHCDKEVNVQQVSPDNESRRKCKKCGKEFQDARCLKIHKTKMKHWGNSYDDAERGPVRKPKNKAKPNKNKKRQRSSDSSKAAKKYALTYITS